MIMAGGATRAARRDYWVALGLLVSALSATVSSYAGLHSLALASGWHPWVAPLFPLTVDCYAMTAVRVWLARSTRSGRARRFARANAFLAILLSVLGNATWHLIAAGLVEVGWVVVVLVGAVPPVSLGLVVHLAVLRTQDDGEDGKDEAVLRDEAGGRRDGPAGSEDQPPAVPGTEGTVLQWAGTKIQPSGTVPTTSPPPLPDHRYAAEAGLLTAAKEADAAHRSRYGKPITRDRLRRELRVGGDRATAVLRKLRERGHEDPAQQIEPDPKAGNTGSGSGRPPEGFLRRNGARFRSPNPSVRPQPSRCPFHTAPSLDRRPQTTHNNT